MSPRGPGAQRVNRSTMTKQARAVNVIPCKLSLLIGCCNTVMGAALAGH